MSFDAHKNFAYSTVATAPSPASSGTSLVVQAGDGVKFPAASFNATVWPAGANPTTANAEIVRVTAIGTDTFTITRTQESTSARSIIVGDQVAATITAKTLTDVENASSLAKLYDYTVTGADKASIDTNVDDGGNGAALLPTTYAMLEIFISSRTDETAILSGLDIRFNNDSAANYWRGFIVTTSTGTTPLGSMSGSAETAILGVTAGASSAANIPGVLRMTIPNYGGTIFDKVAEWSVGAVDSTSGNTHRQVGTEMAIWLSTAAINRISIFPDTAGKKLKVGTRLLIYARP